MELIFRVLHSYPLGKVYAHEFKPNNFPGMQIRLGWLEFMLASYGCPLHL